MLTPLLMNRKQEHQQYLRTLEDHKIIGWRFRSQPVNVKYFEISDYGIHYTLL